MTVWATLDMAVINRVEVNNWKHNLYEEVGLGHE